MTPTTSETPLNTSSTGAVPQMAFSVITGTIKLDAKILYFFSNIVGKKFQLDYGGCVKHNQYTWMIFDRYKIGEEIDVFSDYSDVFDTLSENCEKLERFSEAFERLSKDEGVKNVKKHSFASKEESRDFYNEYWKGDPMNMNRCTIDNGQIFSHLKAWGNRQSINDIPPSRRHRKFLREAFF